MVFVICWLSSTIFSIRKRKAELRIFEKNGILTRQVLKYYSIPLLLRLESIVSTGCFITYSFWASGPIFQGSSSSWMLLTVPLVLLGIFRYQYLSDPSLINKNNKKAHIDCENPVNILFKDNFIKATVISWIFLVLIISLINNFS